MLLRKGDSKQIMDIQRRVTSAGRRAGLTEEVPFKVGPPKFIWI